MYRVLTTALLVLLAAEIPASSAERISYNRDIRPILADHCFACHGPDSAARKAKLRLDQREAALARESWIPGKPDESEGIRRILATDPKEIMPPPAAHKKLTATQKALLRRWVAEGAEYQPHWSLIAPTRPPLPEVRNSAWIRTPLDRFILARIEAAGLTPAPEADRRTLARRLSLDLTGLPPSPDDVEAFAKNPSADAYEQYVDRLMRSPHWGEHRGRYWLDAARYADTHGIHFDNFREVWSYREWVINALNANMPFDRFTIEQLAGDLLPNATLEQKIATGFNRCNITTSEGGAIDEEYLVLYARDRTETVSQVWLGLTAGCAVCHDHKFDPLSMRDFYSMAAFFNNTTQRAMDGNVRDTPPILPVPRLEDRPQWEALNKELVTLRSRSEAHKTEVRPEFDRWLASAKAEDFRRLVPLQGLVAHAPLTEGKDKAQVLVAGQNRALALAGGATWDVGHLSAKGLKTGAEAAFEVPDIGDFERDRSFSFGAWVRVPRRNLTGALFARMDNGSQYRGWDLWLENGKIGSHIIHAWPDNALKVVAKNTLDPGKWHHVFITYDGTSKASGLRIFVNGTPQEVETQADKLSQTVRTQVPFKVGQRHTAEKLPGIGIQDIRLYDRSLPPTEVEQLTRATRVLPIVGKPKEKRTPQEIEELFGWWLVTLDETSRSLSTQIAKVEAEEVRLRSRGTIAHVMNERPEPAMAHILFRGEYDKRKDAVNPEVPKALPPMPKELPRNRLGFAQWLLRPEHPLTARVTVNRYWQELFGSGLVRSAGDFGITGELPSHPELLDWLAVEFRQGNWDVKSFFKMMVMSSTYRQAAVVTSEKAEKDPTNRLLARGPRFRMDAEMVRDYALSVSGMLSRKIGGPSVKPYQPEGVWEAVAMIGSNTRDYRPDNGEALYRRSMYTFWKRSAPPASMDIFNAPNRETCTVKRERTNTPLQALVTLNDPQFVEAARQLAQAALRASPEPLTRFDVLAKRLLARSFTKEEGAVVQSSLNDLLAYYKGHPEEAKKLISVGESRADPTLDPPTLAAYTMLANQLLNLDEVLNK